MSTSGLREVRDLVLQVCDAPGGWGEGEFVPWFEQRPQLVEELRNAGSHCAPVEWGDELLTGLHALSRLADILIEPYQPASDEWAEWSGPSPSAWPAFLTAINATAISEDHFHPFFHEIVAVEAAEDPDEPPTVVEEHWPGALIGGLLLTRGGVTVRAGSSVMDPAVAARSCLYWAWRRRNRAVADLSHGWGRNSQWGTDFRRDYVVAGELHYNVDCRNTQHEDPGLSDAERRELVRFRHGLLKDFGPDRFPFLDSHVEDR